MNPYLVGKQIAENAGRYSQNQRDTSAIDEILSQSKGATRQQDLDALLAQVISRVSPERQKEPLAFLQGQQTRLSQQQQLQRQELQRRSAAKQFGLPEDTPLDIIKEVAKQRNKPAQATPATEFEKSRQKQIADYYQNAIEEGGKSDELIDKLQQTEKAVQGDVAGPGLLAMAKANPYTAMFVGVTPDEAELQTLNKYLLEGTKGIFGSRPTEREIYTLLQQFMPAIGKSKEANMRSIAVMRKAARRNQLARDFIQEITENGTKYVPDLESKMHAAMKPYTDELMKDLKEEQKLENKQKEELKSKPQQAATPQNFVDFALKNKKKTKRKGSIGPEGIRTESPNLSGIGKRIK